MNVDNSVPGKNPIDTLLKGGEDRKSVATVKHVIDAFRGCLGRSLLLSSPYLWTSTPATVQQ